MIYLKKDRQTVAGIIVLDFTGKVESQAVVQSTGFVQTANWTLSTVFEIVRVLKGLYKDEN